MDLDRRADYDWGVLLESEADPDPVAQLRAWLDEAEQFGEAEPNSMVLATADATGRPEARNVLLRGLDDAGALRFFTNHGSHKAHEIASNPNVSAVVLVVGDAPSGPHRRQRDEARPRRQRRLLRQPTA